MKTLWLLLSMTAKILLAACSQACELDESANNSALQTAATTESTESTAIALPVD